MTPFASGLLVGALATTVLWSLSVILRSDGHAAFVRHQSAMRRER